MRWKLNCVIAAGLIIVSLVTVYVIASSYDFNQLKPQIAHSTALVIDTNLVSAAGEGTINLKTEGIDFSFQASTKAGLGSSSLGKVNINFGEFMKPFKLAGTLAKPALAGDPTETAISIGKVVGGTALFGPAGIAASLAGGSSNGGNVCYASLDAWKKGVKPAGDKAEDIKGATRKATEATGDKLKKLFGK